MPPQPAPREHVAQSIRADIASGRLKPGDRLPSSHTLAEHFGVARDTAARAVAILAKEGLVCTSRGALPYIAGADPTTQPLPTAPAMKPSRLHCKQCAAQHQELREELDEVHKGIAELKAMLVYVLARQGAPDPAATTP